MLLRLCWCAEPVVVEVMFRNPLKVPLALSRLSLLWKFADDGHAADGGEDAGEELVNNGDASEQEVGMLLSFSRTRCWFCVYLRVGLHLCVLLYFSFLDGWLGAFISVCV